MKCLTFGSSLIEEKKFDTIEVGGSGKNIEKAILVGDLLSSKHQLYYKVEQKSTLVYYELIPKPEFQELQVQQKQAYLLCERITLSANPKGPDWQQPKNKSFFENFTNKDRNQYQNDRNARRGGRRGFDNSRWGGQAHNQNSMQGNQNWRQNYQTQEQQQSQNMNSPYQNYSSQFQHHQNSEQLQSQNNMNPEFGNERFGGGQRRFFKQTGDRGQRRSFRRGGTSDGRNSRGSIGFRGSNDNRLNQAGREEQPQQQQWNSSNQEFGWNAGQQQSQNESQAEGWGTEQQKNSWA